MSEQQQPVEENRRQRRRKEDLEMARELEHFAKNRVTRRIALILLPMIGVACTAAWARWKGIPSAEWQRKIEIHQQQEEEQRQAVRRELDLLKAEVRWNANLSIEQRAELSKKIDRLEQKLDTWFERAGR